MGYIEDYNEYKSKGGDWQRFVGARRKVSTDVESESFTYANSTARSLTDKMRTAEGNVYVCTTAGTTSASGQGPTGTGSDITDGTAVFRYDVQSTNRLTLAKAVLSSLDGDFGHFARYLSLSYGTDDTTAYNAISGQWNNWANDYVA